MEQPNKEKRRGSVARRKSGSHRSIGVNRRDRPSRSGSHRGRVRSDRSVGSGADFSGMHDLRMLITSCRPDRTQSGEDLFTLSGIRAARSIGPPVALDPDEQPRIDAKTKVGLAALFMGTVGLVIVTLVLLGRKNEANAGEGFYGMNASTLGVAMSPNESISVTPAKENGKLYNLVSMGESGESAKETDARSAGIAVANHLVKKSNDLPEEKKENKKRKTRKKLPSSLSKSVVKERLKRVSPRVKKCDQGYGGVVVLRMVIGSNGKVVSSRAAGAFAGTVTGKCAARAVRKARFPRFAGPKMKVTYPFRL